MFGGTDGRNPLKDLHILDTCELSFSLLFYDICLLKRYLLIFGKHVVASHTWISPSIRGEGPEAREGHSATLVGKRLFIFGGCGKSSHDEELYYNDLYILNTGASPLHVRNMTVNSLLLSHPCILLASLTSLPEREPKGLVLSKTVLS